MIRYVTPLPRDTGPIYLVLHLAALLTLLTLFFDGDSSDRPCLKFDAENIGLILAS